MLLYLWLDSWDISFTETGTLVVLTTNLNYHIPRHAGYSPASHAWLCDSISD